MTFVKKVEDGMIGKVIGYSGSMSLVKWSDGNCNWTLEYLTVQPTDDEIMMYLLETA